VEKKNKQQTNIWNTIYDSQLLTAYCLLPTHTNKQTNKQTKKKTNKKQNKTK
jgi:hypothetical protein